MTRVPVSNEAALDKALLAALDTLSHQVAPLFERARAAGLVKGHVARLHAKLTASEAAREALRAAAVRVLHGDKNSTARRDDGFPHCRTRRLGNLAMVVRSKRLAEEAYIELDDRDGILANALAADQTTARESAETTAEETMTDTFALYCKKAPIEARPWRTGDDMARVSLSPADADSGSPKAGDMIARNPASPDDQWLIAANYFAENYKPAPAQPPEPVEPSDELPSVFGLAQIRYEAEKGQDPSEKEWFGNLALYRAGLAAERAERVEWLKSDAARVELNAVTENGELKVELERVRAELAAQAQARRVPTREELMCLIYGAVPDNHYTRSDAYELADAVLRLFAEADATEPLVTSDNEPPSPLPRTLPKGTKADAGGADVEATSEATLELHTASGPIYWSRWSNECGHGFVRARDIDWSHYRAQQRAAEPTPGTVLGTARIVFRGKTEPREVEAPDAPEDHYVPTVGERVVLVASPDQKDKALVGRDGIIEAVRPALDADYHYGFRVKGADGLTYSIHRDATWRPASAAPATLIADKGPINEVEPDSAWLKRTVEELTTARPVEVTEDEDGMLKVTAPGLDPLYFGEYLRTRDDQGVARVLRGNEWPLRRNCITDPSPQPGGFLDALTARVAHLEDQVRGMTEGTASEFRRVDATLRAHSERIEAGVDALKDTERYLDRGVDAQSKRLDSLERKVRELDQRTIGSAK